MPQKHTTLGQGACFIRVLKQLFLRNMKIELPADLTSNKEELLKHKTEKKLLIKKIVLTV